VGKFSEGARLQGWGWVKGFKRKKKKEILNQK
jgi:hypothetical protein